VRLALGLIGCYQVFSLSFRIIVFQDQFFVLYGLSVPQEITVVPLKDGE
jgi:hypothetical protein